ncbi:uncharacterized protein B0T15DRAFT_181507 [Chaetomium strumarium]|uniref:Fringe-like glycosyltransferase domain-containing protein n=1 Tax=Chaetomium strumarium TaxID=1170767 RepID=A0AAJ0GX87_9PEZI|nr:hypothetical protein B0T15DRAFT_181507 [Chaetomium strumarium]
MDVKRKVTALVQRATNNSSIPNPLARALRLAAIALIVLILYLKVVALSSRAPPIIVSDLVLQTSDLRDVKPAVAPGGSGEHAIPANGTGPSPKSQHAMNCNPDIRRLGEIRDRYALDNEIEYLKRYIRFTRKPDVGRPSYTVLEQRFLPDDDNKSFQVLQLSGDEGGLPPSGKKCPDPLEVSVPQSPFPADVDLSDFIFAISTTVRRLADHPTTIPEWAHWLTDGQGHSNGGKLLLRLVDATDAELRNVTQRLADAGIDAEVGAWDSRRDKEMAVRYLNLVPLLFSHDTTTSSTSSSSSAKTRKWFVLCDDDTFFPAIHSLAAHFAQHYDHTKPLYIGTLSEDVTSVATHGSQAFGGGGVFLSRALARIISRNSSGSVVHTTCRTRQKIRESDSGWGPQGDILLRKCIYENSAVRLTPLRQLWQLDLAGDASGFYEAGFKPYSLHHFQGGGEGLWHTAYPLATAQIAHACGEDCPYQRFVTADGFVIANGYSVAHYPGGGILDHGDDDNDDEDDDEDEDGIDLEQVERTFCSHHEDKGWNFDYMFGPQRASLHGTGKKIAWELREAEYKREEGVVVQVYIRRKDDQRWVTKEGKKGVVKPMRETDGVLELVWIPG